MKVAICFTILFFGVLASANSLPKKHEMPKSLEVLSHLPRLLRKQTKGDPIKDCTKCYNDVLSAIESCSHLGDDTTEIILCIESILATSADCIVCICDILGILGGADISACDPVKIMEARAKSAPSSKAKLH